MKIGDEIYVHGFVDEIRKDVVIIKNEGGYFGTVPGEIIKYVEREQKTTVSVLPDENGYYPNVCGMCANAESELCKLCSGNKNFVKATTKIPDFYKKYAEQDPCEDCDYSEIMDWEQDAKTGKAKPIYWCERHKEPCDDAISRQAVLDIVCGAYEKDGWGESNFYKAIKQLPSVRPQEQKSCEKCSYAEETDGSHCYECVKGESKFKAQKSEE